MARVQVALDNYSCTAELKTVTPTHQLCECAAPGFTNLLLAAAIRVDGSDQAVRCVVQELRLPTQGIPHQNAVAARVVAVLREVAGGVSHRNLLAYGIQGVSTRLPAASTSATTRPSASYSVRLRGLSLESITFMMHLY